MRHGLFGSVNIWAGMQPHAWLGRLVSYVAQWEVYLLTKGWLEIRTKSTPHYDQHFKMALPALKGFMLHYLQEKPLGGQKCHDWTGPLLRRSRGPNLNERFKNVHVNVGLLFLCVLWLRLSLCRTGSLRCGNCMSSYIYLREKGNSFHINNTCWAFSKSTSPAQTKSPWGLSRDYCYSRKTTILLYCFIL